MISPEELRRYPYFTSSCDECVMEVAKICEEKTFKPGDVLFEESAGLIATSKIYEKGIEATHLLLLTKGDVDIALTLGSGEKVIVGTLVAGDLMGVSALIPPYQLTAAGIAKTGGEYIQIEAAPLRRICEENPDLGYRLMQNVAKGLMNRLQSTRVELAGESYNS
ncbi:MAG: cyclic nucleotide-binding domain-containing protein [Anaerolineales bacterium]|jgi:CRP/FNR family cyclic AMP-dependent transcriptional regulator